MMVVVMMMNDYDDCNSESSLVWLMKTIIETKRDTDEYSVTIGIIPAC